MKYGQNSVSWNVIPCSVCVSYYINVGFCLSVAKINPKGNSHFRGAQRVSFELYISSRKLHVALIYYV